MAIQLEVLRKACNDFNQRWVKSGGELTTYRCSHCECNIETRKPKLADVDSKGYWDAMIQCTNCGGLNFVMVFADGTTVVNTVGCKHG